MSPLQIGLALFAGMLALMALRAPIAVSMFVPGAIGYLAMAGEPALLNYLKGLAWARLSVYDLSVIPLFLLMGQFATQGGLSRALFAFANALIGHLRGGMAMAAVLACAAFGTVCGSSVATAATVTQVALPEMRRHNYTGRLATGTLAAGGTLGILIPPSVALILYGFAFNVSIGDLFLAGVLPGLMIAAIFAIYVAIRHRRVAQAPDIPVEAAGSRLRAIGSLLPLIVLIVVVFGAIYRGFATPTEAAVIGVVGAMVLALIDRTLSFGVIVESLKATVLFCAAIGLILGASAALQVAMAYTGIPRTIVTWIEGVNLGYYGLLLVIAVILIVLGCFMDGLSMIVLTGSVLLPVAQSAGFDLLWFGVFMVILVEIGLITPPIGFNLFVLQRISGWQLPQLAAAAFPFLLLMLLSLVIITIFPSIVTILPRLL